MKKTPFASLAFDRKNKQTQREKFLEEMAQAAPWPALLAFIEPYYPKAAGPQAPARSIGAPVAALFPAAVLRLSDPGFEDSWYEIRSMRRFADLA